MTLYLFIGIVLFLVICESLFYWRTKLISSHRHLARNLIIGYQSNMFWESVQTFNEFGDYSTMFWDWRKWSFAQCYPNVLPPHHDTHFLGV